ncbi:MAG TPA: site-specific integrase [Terracidiphilus sp.]|nr:site-specific integrase [Terracidiphilus sp.]
MKNLKADDSWFFRYYEDVDGKRVHRNLRIGTVREYPRRRDAEKAVLVLRSTINSGVRSPQTVNELVAHYRRYELTLERKAFATVEAHESYLALHILPKWGEHKLSEVKTVAVEMWLDKMPFAPATKTKIRNIMSAVYSHGIRHEWITFNPISKVRCSAKRLREPDVLAPSEFKALLKELPLRERTAVMLAAATGLRRSEMFALRWSDVNFLTKEVSVTRSCVRNRFGNTKTPASRKPVPLHESVCEVLAEWRKASDYNGDDDFLFPSIRMNGTQPVFPDMVLQKIVRPALVRAGIKGKVIGWHSFRHSLATNLRSLGVDVKVAQELLRHANSRTTMDLYTQAVSADKRDASRKQVELLLG